MTKMMEIYQALELEKKSADVIFDVLNKEKENVEGEINKLMEKLDDIGFRFDKAKKNKEAIEQSMAALERGDFKPSVEEEEKENLIRKQDANGVTAESTKVLVEEEVKKPAVTEKKDTSLTWKHRNCLLVKYGKDGTKLGTYKTRGQLARQLGVEPATVGYYMKQDAETQLAKREFYLKYE